MIAIDLDGTLLNDEKEISEENRKWIYKAYNEHGVIPVITTGRNVSSIEYFTKLLGSDMVEYVIAQNGAIIKDIIKNEYISFDAIPDETVKKAISILKSNNIMASLETDMYVISDSQKTEEVMELYAKLGDNIKIVEDLKAYDTRNDRISIVTGEGEAEELESVIGKLEELEELLVVPISKYLAQNGDFVYERYYIEATAKGVSKGNAIIVLAEHLGIKEEEIIVMGDGANDISMFEIGVLKVAMGNGAEILKEKADYVTTSNNGSGVAKAIQKYIFGIV